MSLHYPDHWSPASEPPMSHVHMEFRSRRRNYLNLPPPVGVTPVSQLKKGPMSPSFILELTFVTGMSWNLRQKVCLLDDQ